jgi:hypothetical protein
MTPLEEKYKKIVKELGEHLGDDWPISVIEEKSNIIIIPTSSIHVYLSEMSYKVTMSNGESITFSDKGTGKYYFMNSLINIIRTDPGYRSYMLEKKIDTFLHNMNDTFSCLIRRNFGDISSRVES